MLCCPQVLLLRGCRDRNVVQFIGACLSGPRGGPGGGREGGGSQEGEAMLVTEFMEVRRYQDITR